MKFKRMALTNGFTTKFTFPSSLPGAVLDVTQGGLIICLTLADLRFLADLYEIIEMNENEDDVVEAPAENSGLLED